ncbi:hypothetical protein B0H14DRAFT_1176665 [Mycena olivaceomarginata]|nr:hypothetical protein B0H14DRAFT_1176665 [Mycena olivaceomarginata]
MAGRCSSARWGGAQGHHRSRSGRSTPASCAVDEIIAIVRGVSVAGCALRTNCAWHCAALVYARRGGGEPCTGVQLREHRGGRRAAGHAERRRRHDVRRAVEEAEIIIGEVCLEIHRRRALPVVPATAHPKINPHAHVDHAPHPSEVVHRQVDVHVRLGVKWIEALRLRDLGRRLHFGGHEGRWECN